MLNQVNGGIKWVSCDQVHKHTGGRAGSSSTWALVSPNPHPATTPSSAQETQKRSQTIDKNAINTEDQDEYLAMRRENKASGTHRMINDQGMSPGVSKVCQIMPLNNLFFLTH